MTDVVSNLKKKVPIPTEPPGATGMRVPGSLKSRAREGSAAHTRVPAGRRGTEQVRGTTQAFSGF